MESSSKKSISTDLPQNRVGEDRLLKLKIEKEINAEKLQELKEKLSAKKMKLGGLQEEIKSRDERISEMMFIRDKYDFDSEYDDE